MLRYFGLVQWQFPNCLDMTRNKYLLDLISFMWRIIIQSYLWVIKTATGLHIQFPINRQCFVRLKMKVMLFFMPKAVQYSTAWVYTADFEPPGDAFDLLPRCRWMSAVHGCPPSAIGPSLLLLSVLGTVCPIMSRSHRLCLFSEVASRLSSSGVPSHDFYRNFSTACAVTVDVIFGLFKSSFLTFA